MPRLELNSKSKSSTQPLWIAVAILCVCNLAAYVGLNYARNTNRYWRDFTTELRMEPAPEPDRLSSQRATEMLNGGCELGYTTVCRESLEDPTNSDDEEDSPKFVAKSMASLKQRPLPVSAAKLLEKYTYPSPQRFYADLWLRGGEDDAIAIMNAAVTSLDMRVRLGEKWYLLPAFQYFARGRDYDGLVLLDAYRRLFERPMKDGEWVSVPGIDATDVVALLHLFCSSGKSFEDQLCVAGFTKALARSHEASENSGSAYAPTSDFSDEYAALPRSLRSELLLAYLRLWSWQHGDPIPTVPTGMSPAQTAAWYYAKGATFRYVDEAPPVTTFVGADDSDDDPRATPDQKKAKRELRCKTISMSREAFQKSLESDRSDTNLFRHAAEAQLAGLQPCK